MRILAQLRRHAQTCQQSASVDRSITTDEQPDTAEILKQLYFEDRKAEPSRHGGELIHASHLVHNHKCARMLYLANYMSDAGVSFDESPFGAMKLVWALGRAAEKHARRQLLKSPSIRARAYGMWKCKCEVTEARGHFPATASRCTRCGTHPHNYHEITLGDEDSGTMGNPDMIVQQGRRYTVVEIKSIKKASSTQHQGFDTIEHPMPKHVEQGANYVDLGERNGLYMHRAPMTLYVLKDYDPKKWYKALLPTPELLEAVNADVADARAAGRAYRTARKAVELDPTTRDENLPPKIAMCAAKPDKCKKSCPVWAECYARG